MYTIYVSTETPKFILNFHLNLYDYVPFKCCTLYIYYCQLITVQEPPNPLCLHANYSDESFLASYEDTFCVLGACLVWLSPAISLRQSTQQYAHITTSRLWRLCFFLLYMTEPFAFYLWGDSREADTAAESKQMEALVGCAK